MRDAPKCERIEARSGNAKRHIGITHQRSVIYRERRAEKHTGIERSGLASAFSQSLCEPALRFGAGSVWIESRWRLHPRVDQADG